jgi:hypothetical protein
LLLIKAVADAGWFAPLWRAAPQYTQEGEGLPAYEVSSSHFRGCDAWLVERVTREFVVAYAQVGVMQSWQGSWKAAGR